MAYITRGRAGLAALIIAVAFLTAWLSLPYAVSIDLVRSALAREIATWTGHEVRIASPLKLRLWPTLRARIDDVTILETGRTDAPPLARIETMEANISFRALLGGDLRFFGFRLVRPQLNLIESPDGGFAWVNGGGRFDSAFDRAEQAVGADPARPDREKLSTLLFATFEIEDGSVSVRRNAWRLAEEVTEIRGRFSWPRLDRPTSFEGSGTWRGEKVDIDLTMDDLLLATAGGRSDLDVAISSPLLSFRFDGAASAGRDFFAEGGIEVSTPSLRRTLNWTRADIAPGRAIGAFNVTAELIAGPERFRFEEARIALDGNTGTGAFELARRPALGPAISGTLDFETLDVESFLAAFIPLPEAGSMDKPIDLSALRQIDLDLRLSTATAGAGGLTLDNVAATAQIRNGQAIFDIGDAVLAGGELAARLQFGTEPSGVPTAQVMVMATDIDMARAGDEVPLPRFVPRARTTLTADLRMPLDTWRHAIDQMSGPVSIRTGEGVMGGFDVGAYLLKAATGGYFRIDDDGQSAMTVSSVSASAVLGDGTARIQEARISMPGQSIVLSGVIPYPSRSLALSGRVEATAGPEPAATAPAAFFIGGAWSRPYLIPVQAAPPQ